MVEHTNDKYLRRGMELKILLPRRRRKRKSLLKWPWRYLCLLKFVLVESLKTPASLRVLKCVLVTQMSLLFYIHWSYCWELIPLLRLPHPRVWMRVLHWPSLLVEPFNLASSTSLIIALRTLLVYLLWCEILRDNTPFLTILC